MPTKREHNNNNTFQLELQKFEAKKLIAKLAWLEDRSTVIRISLEALKNVNDEDRSGV